jgi:hypothetical protein
MDLTPAFEDDVDHDDQDKDTGGEVARQPDQERHQLLQVFHRANLLLRPQAQPVLGRSAVSRGPSALISPASFSWLRMTGV